MEKEKSWGGKRSDTGRPDKVLSKIESEKFTFMATLSDESPVMDLAAMMPCQERGCINHAHQGVVQMVGRIWSVRPTCKEHLHQYVKSVQIEIALDLESWESFKAGIDLERGGSSTEEEYQSAAKSLCRQAIDGFIKAHRDGGLIDPAIII
jgi:hypothetical protein